jgi:putative transposase
LKLIFLVVSRAMSLIRLSHRESWWKDAEILMLRHQLAVAQRLQPRVHRRLTWPDRAWLALLAGTLPIERLAGMRLIVTPGTILRWHRDIVRRRWARLSRQGRPGRPATHRNIRSLVLRLARENESWGTGGSTASWPASESPWRHRTSSPPTSSTARRSTSLP